MYKRCIISGLLILSSWSIYSSHHSHNKEIIPYESIIAREYNRIRGGISKYTSINEIISQTLRGKSPQQKNDIITDLKALRYAIHLALVEAENDGKRMWYWWYIWKDNNPTIQTLTQYEDDVAAKIYEFEFASQPDYIRALWYSTKVLGYMTFGIGLSYLSQSYLSKDNYTKNGHHGLTEMFYAPMQGGMDIAKYVGTSAFEAVKYAVKYSNDFLSGVPTPPVIVPA